MVADGIAKWLDEKGIHTVFGIVGGGNTEIFTAIARLGKTEIVCVHHEQAAVMAAAYFHRVSGVMSAALVTTGAGSTNAITGVVAAYMDSIPVLVISGNEGSKHMNKPVRVWGVQGYDSTEMVRKWTKYSNRVMKPELAISCLESAYESALHGRQGPVWVDIPKDIQSVG